MATKQKKAENYIRDGFENDTIDPKRKDLIRKNALLILEDVLVGDPSLSPSEVDRKRDFILLKMILGEEDMKLLKILKENEGSFYQVSQEKLKRQQKEKTLAYAYINWRFEGIKEDFKFLEEQENIVFNKDVVFYKILLDDISSMIKSQIPSMRYKLGEK